MNKPEFKEFTNNPLHMEKRSLPNYSDEFVFRRAMIYECLGPQNDKLKVQVLPELQDINEEEMADLPEYPPFFKGEVITGLDYKNEGKKAEYVWVICTPDLQVGYILGKANVFGQSGKNYKDSFSYKDVRAYIRERLAEPEDFDYNHLHVVKWVSSDNGGMIQCYNYLTGDWVLLNTSGSIITVQQKKIYMRVGTPNANSKTAFSDINMTADQIVMDSQLIHLNGKTVILGGVGTHKIGLLPGNSPSNDNGIPVIPAEGVWSG